MSRLRIIISAACLCLAGVLVSGCSKDAAEAAGPGGAKGGPAGKGGGPPPAMVKVGVAQAGDLADEWRYLGRVRARDRAALAAGVAGNVLTVAGREGDRVIAGDAVVTLDREVTEARLSAVRASVRPISSELQQARREQDRAESLPLSVVPEAEREKYRARVSLLEAQIAATRAQSRELQAQLDRHAIMAPFDGVITARHVEPGGWVNPGSPLLELVGTDTLEILVDVAAALRPYLAEGGPATLLGEPPVPATIVRVLPTLDATTRTVLVRLTPDERASWLTSGGSVEVAFDVSIDGAKGVIVSRDALVRGPVSVRVIKADGRNAVHIPVRVIATADDKALVSGDGLVAGDAVIVRGNERLRPGQPIQVIE